MPTFFTQLGPINKGGGLGPFSNILNYSNALDLFQKIISGAIAAMTIAGGIWFMLQFITGAYSWMNAGGDKSALKAAQDKITHAVSGLVLLVAAYALISIMGSLVGLDILNPYKTLIGM